MSERIIMTNMITDPELTRLFAMLNDRPPMTKEEIAAQRKSWVIGEMMLEHPEMTRDDVEAIYDKL